MIVLVDLDGTLVDRAGAFARWARAFVVGAGGGDDDVRWLLDLDADGYTPRADVATALRRRLGLDEDVPQLVDMLLFEHVDAVRPYPGVADELAALRRSGGAVVVVVTNGTVAQQERKLHVSGLREQLDDVVVSEAVGAKKPDAGVFEVALQRAAALVGPVRRGWSATTPTLTSPVGGPAGSRPRGSATTEPGPGARRPTSAPRRPRRSFARSGEGEGAYRPACRGESEGLSGAVRAALCVLDGTGYDRARRPLAATIARMTGRTYPEGAADLLLAGPRGRRALAALLGSPHDPDEAAPLWHAETLLTDVTAGRTTERAVADHVAAAVSGTDLASLAATTDPAALLPALQEAVDWAWYWQEPSEHDVLLALPLVIAALRPLAAAVLASPAAAWWSRPIDTHDQHHVEHVREDKQVDDDLALHALDGRAVAAALARWRAETLTDEEHARRERPIAVGASWSGHWWSTPAPVGLLTSRAHVPASLGLVEDSAGWPTALTRRLRLRTGLRVYEVDGPGAWERLASRYPLRVTRSRRHDWYRATGWAGSWVLPDWSSVAADWDGVHVSPLGYLTTAGRALVTDVPGDDAASGALPGPARTLLAGWDPGTTWWLRCVLDGVEDPGGVEPPVRWQLGGGHHR